MTIIETDRLLLRLWKQEDISPYYSINQDQRVIAFLPSFLMVPTEQHAADFMVRMNNQHGLRKHALWALELKATGELMGFIGLNYTDWLASLTPAVEIGWRLGSQYWGYGYATEGAMACLAYGFNTLGLHEIVSFTVPANVRSIAVMERIGMYRDIAGDFTHPKLALDHPLSQHVLYRLSNTVLK